MSRHEGVSCDSCSVSNFSGRRFKCLVCSDYDLCSSCYDRGEHGHPPHPMQCLLNKKDFMIYYGETFKGRSQSYTCPCCGQMGFTLDTLISHTKNNHRDGHSRILCPVCVATRHVIHPAVSEDIATHLQREHSFSSGVRDIVALLEEPAGGVIVNRRANLQLRFPDNLMESSTTFSSHLGQSVESVRPFSDLLSQISTRCSEVGPVVQPRNISRSHSRLSQGKQRDKGGPEAPIPPPPQFPLRMDCIMNFISRDLEPVLNESLESTAPGDKGLFLQDLLIGSLDPKNSKEFMSEPKEPIAPPELPDCLDGWIIYLPKCIERIPSIADLPEEPPPPPGKQSRKGIHSRTSNK